MKVVFVLSLLFLCLWVVSPHSIELWKQQFETEADLYSYFSAHPLKNLQCTQVKARQSTLLHPSFSVNNVSCCAKVNETFFDKYHFDFTLCLDLGFNWDNKSINITVTYNNEVIYQKIVSPDTLTIPICVPILDKIHIKLCLYFTDIHFNSATRCFRCDVSAGFQFLFFPPVTIIPKTEIGYNKDKC